ncbi:MAG: phage major capsid protein [Alphaproteobacteria bacterium]
MDAVKQIMGELKTLRTNQDEKVATIEKQVNAIKEAQRIMEESVYRADSAEITGTDDQLKKFVGEDGSIRWTSGKTRVKTAAGLTTVTESGLLDTEENLSNWHVEMKRLANDRMMIKSMLVGDKSTPKMDLAIARHLAVAPRSIAAQISKANYDGSGVGAELIPDQFLAQLHMEYQVPTVVRSLFNEVQMTSNTMLAPRIDRGGRPYIKGTVTSDNPALYPVSTVSMGQAQITAKGLATRYILDEELIEDSAVLLLPAMQRMIAKDMRDALEDAIINGDSASTHQDDIANWDIRGRWGSTGLGGSNDHRRLFVGLRAAAFDKTTTLNINSFDAAKMLELISQLGEYAASDKVLIVSPEALYENLMGLEQLITLDKFGPQATILTGQLGSIFGMPVVVSRFMSDDLATTGKYTGSGATTGMLVVSRESWNIFARRGIQIQQEQDITSGAYNMVATERLTFDSLDASTVKNVAFGFNL